ncbi:hypothetical protein NAPIS_ORF01203 [Vairimorpha apis BRL 01]|uniref:Mis18 domain-containing protein n=1 Tax=Vairimorpha apis BRL 01 TaxID=1037528 RepID=T0L0Y0_9MICR|nr:hypothetical protein NAPIS_ORF01203 [Vairimorpha apis BRL 01]
MKEEMGLNKRLGCRIRDGEMGILKNQSNLNSSNKNHSINNNHSINTSNHNKNTSNHNKNNSISNHNINQPTPNQPISNNKLLKNPFTKKNVENECIFNFIKCKCHLIVGKKFITTTVEMNGFSGMYFIDRDSVYTYMLGGNVNESDNNVPLSDLYDEIDKIQRLCLYLYKKIDERRILGVWGDILELYIRDDRLIESIVYECMKEICNIIFRSIETNRKYCT